MSLSSEGKADLRAWVQQAMGGQGEQTEGRKQVFRSRAPLGSALQCSGGHLLSTASGLSKWQSRCVGTGSTDKPGATLHGRAARTAAARQALQGALAKRAPGRERSSRAQQHGNEGLEPVAEQHTAQQHGKHSQGVLARGPAGHSRAAWREGRSVQLMQNNMQHAARQKGKMCWPEGTQHAAQHTALQHGKKGWT